MEHILECVGHIAKEKYAIDLFNNKSLKNIIILQNL